MSDFFNNFNFNDPTVMIIIGVVLLLVVISVVKALFRLAITVAVIGLIAVVFFGMSPQEVIDKGKQMTAVTVEYVNKNVKPIIFDQIQSAEIKKDANGHVLITGKDFTIGFEESGNFTLKIKTLNLSLTKEQLAKYLNEEEMKKFMQMLEDKKNELQTK